MNNEMKWYQILACCFITAIIMFIAVMVTSPAFAEKIRRVEVVDFDFETSEVIFEDEDGFLWTCPFGEFNWTLGEEYTLFLSENGEINIKEVGFGLPFLFL